ncbi:MAG: hypothetical protein E7395_00975 [Ruminococcaceae bacterium]|nr:hypothetical protein [Oscillospiraceae bacterium]
MKLTTKEIIIFAMFGAIMYASKMIMEILPNIHLIGVFVVVLTVVYGAKALYPIYVYVFLTGLLAGFSTWWVPYLYIWTVLWAFVMLLPKNINPRLRPIVYMSVCALHGFCYGILYAPCQMLFYGLSFKGVVAWVAAGFAWDIVHGVSNFFCASLACPLISILNKLNRSNIN